MWRASVATVHFQFVSNHAALMGILNKNHVVKQHCVVERNMTRQELNDQLVALRRPLTGFFMKRTHNPSMTDDLVQETLLRVSTKMAQLEDPSKLLPWVFRIARNIWIDELRLMNKKKTIEDDLNTLQSALEDNYDSDFLDFASCVVALIPALSQVQREAVERVDIQGMTQKAYAEEYNLPYSTAKARLQRGRAQLRQYLFTYCVDPYTRQPKDSCTC